jgi:hypothetical protein
VLLAPFLAEWIAKVRAIEPNLPLRVAYRLAWRYWLNPSPELDAYLALKDYANVEVVAHTSVTKMA